LAKVDILEELQQEGKFSEFLLISWGIIELRADESILKAYCLSSQNPKADPLMELSIGEKLAILKDVGYLSQDDYSKVLEFKKKRNELFHHGGLFIRGLTDEQKKEIMNLGIVAVDIMEKTAASIKQTVLVP
jgi:hypothetical protein